MFLSPVCSPSLHRFLFRRYVISVSKNACVGDVKRELIKTLEKDDKEIKGDDIVMAEVSNSSLARTLVSTFLCSSSVARPSAVLFRHNPHQRIASHGELHLDFAS